MTFREKLQMEHPWMNETITDVVIEEMCPCDLGYEYSGKCKGFKGYEKCAECWNREMPNTEPKADGIPVIPQREVDAYNKGHADGVAQGMNDAWELAKTLYDKKCEEIEKIFDVEGGFWSVIRDFTPQEAIAKLKAYEEAQEIKVGDVILLKNFGVKGTVLDINVVDNAVHGIDEDGKLFINIPIDTVQKIGKKIDVNKI